MKRFFKLIFYLLTGAALILSCNCKDDTEPINTIEYFPNSIGYQWRYILENNEYKDTVIVTIIGDTIFSDQKFKVWEYASFDDEHEEYVWDYQYVNSDSDSISLFGLIKSHMLIQPFEVGKFWVNPNDYYDSTQVLGIEQITIGNNFYGNAYKLHRKFHLTIVGYIYDYWFQPHVGMVKYYKTFGFPPTGEGGIIWTLIDYNFKE